MSSDSYPELRLPTKLRSVVRTIIQILLISVTLACASTANAKSSGNRASSQSEAAQIAKESYGGKILKVQLDSSEKPAKYRVKLLTEDGTVKIVTIMASDKQGK